MENASKDRILLTALRLVLRVIIQPVQKSVHLDLNVVVLKDFANDVLDYNCCGAKNNTQA